MSLALLAACSATRHIPDRQYLLRKNKLDIKSDQRVTRRGTINDQLAALVAQKPNTYVLGTIPYKLLLYEARYRKYTRDSGAASFQIKSKTVEPPVIYDSSLKSRSVVNMKGFLFNEGYFYARVTDTTVFKQKKAVVTYRIQSGNRYLINDLRLDVDDTEIKKLVASRINETALQRNLPFSFTLLQDERSRIINNLRNEGYYRLTQENVDFELDTSVLQFRFNPQNPLESAVTFIARQQRFKNPVTNIRITIRAKDDSLAYRRFAIGRVSFYPDYNDRADFRDSTMSADTVNGVVFRYHKKYVRPKVLLSHTFLEMNTYYRQRNYDQTITKLNELGVFQYVRLNLRVDTAKGFENTLRLTVLATPTKRYDFSTNYEISNGSTYTLGNALSFNFFNRNVLRGANQLTVSLTGGLETGYSGEVGNSLLRHFYLLSRNAGINSTLSFPKFIAPVNQKKISRYNVPRTIIGLGVSVLDRVNYFTLTNTKANFSYNWKETDDKTWDVSPAFINILRLPQVSDSFQRRLDSNQFLRNSYRENFIEGENVTFTFNNQATRANKNSYAFVRLSGEEAGGLLTGVSAVTKNALHFSYSQYVKLDADARYYFRRPHATAVLRLFGGWGIPYDKSSTLPYIKQYFVGGAYSIRGWRIRSLGPGSYTDPSGNDNTSLIDRTADIKLEGNAEYRFDIVQLFSGSLRLNGALFADAGNIWLANADPAYPGGEFRFNKLGQDIAASTGAGARVDIGGLFVLRLDAAFPVKKPYVLSNSGWVLRDVAFGDRSWRADNIVLQIAIGYPF